MTKIWPTPWSNVTQKVPNQMLAKLTADCDVLTGWQLTVTCWQVDSWLCRVDRLTADCDCDVLMGWQLTVTVPCWQVDSWLCRVDRLTADCAVLIGWCVDRLTADCDVLTGWQLTSACWQFSWHMSGTFWPKRWLDGFMWTKWEPE